MRHANKFKIETGLHTNKQSKEKVFVFAEDDDQIRYMDKVGNTKVCTEAFFRKLGFKPDN